MPYQGVPLQGMPHQGMPHQGMPQQGMPQQGAPVPAPASGHIRLSPADIDALRVPGERGLLAAMYSCGGVIVLVVAIAGIEDPRILLAAVGFSLYIWLFRFLTLLAYYWYVFGNSVRVTETQYPAIFHVVRQAADGLGLQTMPGVFVLNGHGVVQSWVAKRSSRKGMIVLTSNLVDDLTSSGDTRRLMMLAGRQLGHIATGHFDLWFLKDVIGRFPLVYSAYQRRCHLTADRIGMMIVGDLEESKAALTIMTVGKTLHPQTNWNELRAQSDVLEDSLFAWLCNLPKHYPFMIRRILALEEFHGRRAYSPVRDAQGQPVQSLNIIHYNFYSSAIGNVVIGNGAVSASY